MAEVKKYLDQAGVEYLWSKLSLEDYPNNEMLIAVINALDATKVDKVDGKQLSTEDYTTEDKEKLNGLESDKTYVYTQVFETTSWNIEHNLNKFPSVSIVDSDNNQVWADVQYIDENTVKLNFSQGFTGKVFIN